MISDTQYNSLYVSGSGPGVLYGLPKIHKTDFKEKFQFRPIFAAYNTPSFNLAKFLVPILNPISTNSYTCSNSYEFVKDITSFKCTNDCIMASFDIENLFTNIPLTETINIILNQLFLDPPSVVLGLSREFLINSYSYQF